MEIEKIATWLITGAIAGYFVGFLLTGKKEGYGWFKNLIFGLAGGFVGGYLFVELLKLDPLELSKVKVTLQDILWAVVGTLIVLIILKLVTRKSGKTAKKA